VLNHMYNRFSYWHGTKENLTLLHEIIQVNFFAYVHLASHALPALQRSGGNIIVLSSVAGRIPSPALASYAASKFALEGFFSSLRIELQWRNSGVSVTVCSVGLVGTDQAINSMTEFGLEKVLDLMKPANASDVAFDIVRAGSLRQTEVKTPYFEVQSSLLLNKFAPSLAEWLMSYMMKLSESEK